MRRVQKEWWIRKGGGAVLAPQSDRLKRHPNRQPLCAVPFIGTIPPEDRMFFKLKGGRFQFYNGYGERVTVSGHLLKRSRK